MDGTGVLTSQSFWISFLWKCWVFFWKNHQRRPALLSSLLVAGFWGYLTRSQGLSWRESHWHSCCGCCCCSVMPQQILQNPLLLKPLSPEDTHSWGVSCHSSRVREEAVCLLWVQWYFLFINGSPGAEHQNEFLRMKRAVRTVLCFRRYFKCLSYNLCFVVLAVVFQSSKESMEGSITHARRGGVGRINTGEKYCVLQ